MTIRIKKRGALAASLTALLILTGGALIAQPAAAAPTNPACPWTDPDKTPEERANLLLDASSVQQQMRWLNEAAANIVDETEFETAAGLGVPNGPAVTYPEHPECVLFNADTDGPFGISYVNGTTAFPSPVSQAASWDSDLVRKRGDAMAEEAWSQQYNQIFAPGIDIVRHPWGGRGAEYLGEDPLLAGTLAREWIESARDSNPGQPVASVLKHFVGNQQELDRDASSSNIDERTLHQLYLQPYEIAFEAKPAGVMCGFNQLNGIWSCENPELLTTILRDQLKFEGFVVTDNGSQHSTAASLDAGLDQELSLPRYFTPPALDAALASGEITEEQIRRAAFNVLRAKFASGLQDYELPETGRNEDARTPEHHAIATEIAEKGSVLLKNDANTLPLSGEGQTIAVIGPSASNTPTNGISARTTCSNPLFGFPNAPPSVYECDGLSPLEAITARAAEDGNTVVFDNGSDLATAAATAAAADKVVVFGFTTAGEFVDLQSVNLQVGGDALIEAVSAANPNTVAVLETHGAVLLPWIDSVPAVLQAWWPGEGGGEAIASLLFGDVNPSGKLPVTFMKSVDDLPTGSGNNDQYPGVFANGSTVRSGPTEIRQVNYSEGLQVGYKWYDEQGIEPLFEFGHGLSYTEFEYSKLKVNTNVDAATASATATVSFTVQNTGDVAGAEIPQVYVTLPETAAEPGKRLVSFDRIELAPGEKRTVEVVVDSAASNNPLSIWDVDADAWKIVDGDYTVSVGSSSRDLPLEETVNIDANGPIATTLPSIAGGVASGKKLTADPGVWNEQDLTFSYQWLRNGEPIPGAKKADYPVKKADVGASLSVVVTATPKSGPAGTATSEPTVVVSR